jgi:hypothetical protein
MIERHGIIEAVERAVNRSSETIGYKALLEMGLEEYAFEAVILRHPELFGEEADHNLFSSESATPLKGLPCAQPFSG